MGYVRAHRRRGGVYVHSHYRRNPRRFGYNVAAIITAVVVLVLVIAVLT